MSSFSDISSSGIIEAMQESLSGYSGLERLVSGRTDRLMEGERRRIAILFLDLTGFTELSNAVDHEIVHNLVGCVMGFLSSVVESFGGYVDKFEGDRLMALFGARISAENDSARAVACAMLMLSRLEEVTPLLPGNTAVSARIGINFGSVTVAPDPNGHMTATGVTVNLASRVEEMAIPGKVFVTVNVKDECGDLFEWQDMGETSVRGLKSTVHLFAPIGPGSVQSERWQRAGRLSDLPMVNRIDEIQAIEEAWNMALSDKGTPVLIEIIGEAGIGKSRLVHEFMKRISGAAVLHGHTRPYAQPSFWIWIGLLREYLSIRTNSKEQVLKLIGDFAENSNGSGIRKKIEQVAPVAADLLSLVQSDISRSGSDDSRAKTVALRLLIDAASSRGPVVLVLEDIHWIDEASMKLLKLLLSTHKGLNPLLVVTTRRSAGEVFTDTGVRSVSLTLEPLEKKEIRSISSFLLSDGSIRASLKKDLEKLLLQGAKGNPFYAEEMVLGLLDSGGIILDNDDSWSLTILPDQVQVPPSVQSILQTRIDRLPQHERQLLQVCSVIGPDLRSDVVEAVVSELQLGFNCRDMLENLAGKGYISVSESDKYTFRHDLVQKSAYSTLLKHNRRIIHRLTARSIERLFPEELEALSPILYSHWKSSEMLQRRCSGLLKRC